MDDGSYFRTAVMCGRSVPAGTVIHALRVMDGEVVEAALKAFCSVGVVVRGVGELDALADEILRYGMRLNGLRHDQLAASYLCTVSRRR